MRHPRRLTAALLTAVLLLAGGAHAASAAGMSTELAFVEPVAVAAEFGAPWVLTLQLSSPQTPLIDESSGTVDVFLQGQAGPFASALPVQRGGVVFFAQPSGVPLLGAGTWSFQAVFTPSAGSGLTTSQTLTPASLVITALTVTASTEILDDPAEVAVPTVALSLAGTYFTSRGKAPEGEWSVAVTDDKGVEVFTDTVPPADAEGESVDVPIDVTLRAGKEYAVTTVFTPDPSIAQGIELTNGESTVTYTTPEQAPLAWLVAPVAMAPWLAATLLVLTGLLLAAAIVLAVLYFRRRPKAVPDDQAVAPEEVPDDLSATPEDHSATGTESQDQLPTS